LPNFKRVYYANLAHRAKLKITITQNETMSMFWILNLRFIEALIPTSSEFTFADAGSQKWLFKKQYKTTGRIIELSPGIADEGDRLR